VESHASQRAPGMGHLREVGTRREPSKELPWNEGAAAIYNKKCRVQVLFVKSSRGKSDGKSSGTPGRV